MISKLGRGHQSELARLAGVASTAVNQSFSGKHPLSEATVERYADALGLDPLEMMATGIELLRAATGNYEQAEEAGEDAAPRSSTSKAMPAAPAGKPHRRSPKTGKVRPAQPPQATKAEVEAAPPVKGTAKKGAKKKATAR